MFSKKSILKFLLRNKLILFLTFFIFLWLFIFAKQITKFPSDYVYITDMISVDQPYDEIANEFNEEQYSNTIFSYNSIHDKSIKSHELKIIGNFTVKTKDGKVIFDTHQDYLINKFSGKHVGQNTYLHAPKFLNKNKNFTFYHISKKTPTEMKYVGEEIISGLKVYKYENVDKTPADQTQFLEFLPGVPETRGVKLSSTIIMYIEPISGHMINLEDFSNDYYYYDINTGEKLSPYNKFINTYTNESIMQHVEMAKIHKMITLIAYIYIPLILIIFLIFYILFKIKLLNKLIIILKDNRLVYLFFILGSLVTLIIYFYALQKNHEKIQLYFSNQVSDTIELIKNEVEIYGSVLRGGRGFFDSSEEITRSEWKTFIDSLDIKNNYPGIQGVGFSKIITPNQKESFENSIKDEGFDNFKIIPEGERGIYTSIVFLEPFDDRNQRAFGFDMYSEITRRRAMNEAKKTADIAISGKVTLVQENDDSPQNGFLAYIPVYINAEKPSSIEEREAKIFGYVYSPFRINDLMHEITKDYNSDLSFKIYDGLKNVPEQLIFESNKNLSDENVVFKETKTIYLSNHPWTIEFFNSPVYKKPLLDRLIPIILLIIGLIMTTLLCSIIFVTTKSRKKAQVYAEKMNKDLIESLKVIEQNAIDLNKFKLAVDNAYDHIVITNPEGIILFANNSVERITGFKKEEIIGTKAGKLWGGLMDKEFYKKLWNTIKNEKKNFVGEIKNKRKNGKEYFAFTSISPVLDKNSNVVYFVGIERDITKEKEIDKAKTEFVSLASHQLKTPLSAIKWNTELLLSGDAGKITKKQKTFIEEIETGNQRMITLVNSLLDTSNLDLGKFVIENEKLDLKKLVDIVKEENITKINEKNIKLIESYDEKLTEFSGDKKMTTIIFQNLLSNSIKYTKKKGEVQIEVKDLTRGSKFGNKKITKKSFGIKVSDNGMGIPDHQKDKIFSKMFRADNAKENETDGTGLGLYIIKSIIDQTGGEIWFESKEGEGTSFYITFPITGMKNDTK
jgi:PAS domain S-box-containing protein